ncbi:ABC transporter permease [Thiohalocapsa sp. ML1]|jgi:putative ABC transport system permease protein|uniref:ABC transporter permease n=1 Tax=Thiohalocapsa sp. ML1 TaxID=1431688 RepID=UPI0007322663|nr:ABC transporter permease [Thiohalocapsa sp. ML1]
MLPTDTLASAARALTAHPTRTWLTLAAMAFATAAVVLLSALGEGARRYVLDEFTQLGTHLLIIIPGRNETAGGAPPLLGETPRDLTLDDALALLRSRHVARVAPVSVGAAEVSAGALSREVTILGSTADYADVRRLDMAAGRFLPLGDPERGAPVAVLGQTLAEELFGAANPVGQRVRIGDRRFRVIGLLAEGGVSLGSNMADVAVIPVASAQALFDNPGLFRVLVQAGGRESLAAAAADIRAIIRARHEGEDDVTVITQDALLGTFDRILGALTLAVAGIAAISLAVAGVLIMNVMLVSVSQRTAEVGLLKALGARHRDVLGLFLTEALLLAAAGTVAGILLAYACVWTFNAYFPAFQLVVPVWAPLAAAVVSIGAGLLFGFLPARRAARLDPVRALNEV